MVPAEIPWNMETIIWESELDSSEIAIPIPMPIGLTREKVMRARLNPTVLVPACNSSRLTQKVITNLWEAMAANIVQTLLLEASSPTARPSNTAWIERASTVKTSLIGPGVAFGTGWWWWNWAFRVSCCGGIVSETVFSKYRILAPKKCWNADQRLWRGGWA